MIEIQALRNKVIVPFFRCCHEMYQYNDNLTSGYGKTHFQLEKFKKKT